MKTSNLATGNLVFKGKYLDCVGNRVLRIIFGVKTEKAAGAWRKFHDE
jgi:hypothetical protein